MTAPWDTESAPSLSWIKVHVSVDSRTPYDVTVLIVALNTRNIVVTNNSGFASAGDFLGISGGKGEGRDVTLTGSHGGPVRYRISVNIADSARLLNRTDADVDYTLTWEIQKLDPLVVLGGLLLFNMFFVTEYLLHVRREVKALARRSERAGAGEMPSAALGMPLGAQAQAEPSRGEAKGGGFFGRFAREAPARAPPETVALDTAALGPPASLPPAPPQPRYAPPEPEPEPYAPPYAPQQYAPPQYAQPQYAQPQYAQPQYAQPQYAQPEYAPPEPVAPAPVEAAPPPPPARTRAPPAPPAPPAAAGGQEPVSKVRCPQCKHIVPVFTAERPTPIRCPNCGKRGMLTK